MKVIRYFAGVFVALVLWTTVGAQYDDGGKMPRRGRFPADVAASQPIDHFSADVVVFQPDDHSSPTATTSTSRPAEDFEEVCTRAFKSLLSGEFSEGAALLKAAGSLRADETVVKARTLTAAYLKVRAKSKAERQAELAAAVARVRLARLAEEYRPKLIEAKLADKLLDRVKVIADAVAAADDLLEAGSTSQPADMLKGVLGHLDRAAEELTSARALVADANGDWPEAFRTSARNLKVALAAYRKAWEEVRPSGEEQAPKVASEKVQDALINMSVLISSQPLTVALSYALEAKELTPDSEKFLRQGWVKELVRKADKRGKRLIEEGQWVEALMIYGRSGLSNIDEDNVAFKDMLKKTSRHVRVLNLYARGGLTKPATTTRPATSPATVPASKPRWREMIVGIDTVMVRTAIREIDGNYVKEPDYRKIGIAGLNAVKVLLESRRAAETLDVLKNEQKRLAFLKSIDQQIEYLRRQDERLRREQKSLDYIHVQEVLNRILDLNYETVNLPAEVVNMEFAEGMLAELDPFTSVIWPYEDEDFRKQTMGYFSGIGVQIRKEPGKAIEVVTPLADTPAFRAGIRAGDHITRVGEPGAEMVETRMMELNRAVKLITGKKGTVVVLTIQRAGKSKPFDVSIKRDKIHIQTVKGWRRLPDGKWDFFLDPAERIGYIRLTQFTADTYKELRRALRSLSQATPPARGVILDLRFNPGGLLTSAVDVADEFLSHGLIVRTVRRNEAQSEETASPLGQYQRGEVIVLVNQYSASAAEIVAGALKDWGRARIVGQRTYGKGSVQRLLPLKSRRARLKLTTAYYYLPSKRCLHRTNGAKVWGVDPNISVPVTIRQTNRWAEIRQKSGLLKSIDAGRLSALLSRQLREDIQLQTALLLMRLKLLAEGRQSSRTAKAA